MRRHSHQQAGFTLMELSIVLVIVALLIGAGITMGSSAIKSAQRVTTQERLGAIKSAIEAYVKANGYLPCPVDRAQTPLGNPTTFGREIRPCAASGVGLVRVASNTVDIGGVPVRSLGLPDSYAADAWGNKFTYAATVALETSYSGADAAITMYTGDRSGTYYALTTTTNRATIPSVASAITSGAGAAYVVLSHGIDGRGAFPLRRTAVAVGCGGGNQNDVENCDDANGSFWDTVYNDGSIEASYFDDYIVWAGNSQDRGAISTVATTCSSSCESWCAPCAGTTANLPSAGAAGFTAGTAMLCKKIITSSSPCQATCLWAGTVSAGPPAVKVRCP